MEDIKIKSEDFEFKFRVCGIIKQNDKFLIQKIEGNNFYCLPGGHVEIGEDSVMAAKRELKEEIGVDCKNERLFAVIENLYNHKQKKFHELGFYYLVEPEKPLQTNNFIVNEIDKGVPKRLEYIWVDLEQLKKEDFRPKILKECFKNLDGKLHHYIFHE